MSEKLTLNREANLEAVSEAAAERAQELLNTVENAPGERLSTSAERAQIETLFSKEAPLLERKHAFLDGATSAPQKPLPKNATKKDRNDSYNQTMQHVGTELSLAERAFSKVIHNPSVEKTSEAFGSTFARPNAILAGSFTALVLTTAVYVIARNLGYVLSGFETIGAFIVGWALGLIYDYAKTMFASRPS